MGIPATRDSRDGRDGRFAGSTELAPPPSSTTKRDTRKGTTVTTKRHTNHLLTVAQAAERLGTTERFPRRLIAERRITFVKLGTHVRIPERALDEFIAASTVEAAE